MLKEKNTANTLENTVVAVKLITGEEIIAKLLPSAEYSSSYLFQRPLALVMGEVPGNPLQTQVMFTPWMLALDETEAAKIGREHVLAIAPARKDAAQQYESATNPA